MSSILIKSARLRGHEELCDLYIKDGVFAEIAPGLSSPADETSMLPANWSPPPSAMPTCTWMPY